MKKLIRFMTVILALSVAISLLPMTAAFAQEGNVTAEFGVVEAVTETEPETEQQIPVLEEETEPETETSEAETSSEVAEASSEVAEDPTEVETSSQEIQSEAEVIATEEASETVQEEAAANDKEESEPAKEEISDPQTQEALIDKEGVEDETNSTPVSVKKNTKSLAKAKTSTQESAKPLMAAQANSAGSKAAGAIDSVRSAIKALSADPSDFKASDKSRVEKIWADFKALSKSDQAILDAETSHSKTSQPLGRVLETALWAVWSYNTVDNSTTLDDGTYTASTDPALSSVYSKGKSTSARQKPWSVKSIKVVNGKATATLLVESDTYTGVWMGGKTYPKTNSSGHNEFANIPIDLNSTFYFAGISTTMPIPIAFSLTTSITEPAPEGPADYSKVDAAIKKAKALDRSLYDQAFLDNLDKAIAAVVRGKKASQQAEVDAMAKAIEDALEGKEYKPADYSKVDAALKKIPSDLSKYTKESVAKLNAAKKAVVRSKLIDEQDKVDKMAEAIEKAIKGLVLKGADYSKVDAALKKIPKDLSIYTKETVAKLNEAKKAVVRGKKITQQSQVDKMAQAIEKAIAGLKRQMKDGQIELKVTNNTGMFKVSTAYLDTKKGNTKLIATLNGQGYHYLYKGTYEEAAANGNNRKNWVKGKTNAQGKLEFTIPVASGETYIPIVAISQSYLESFEAGENVLERSFYPRQFVLNVDKKTLVTGDYEAKQKLQITNNVRMFKPEKAVLETLGGPNSNNYKSDLRLTMGSDAFDKVAFGNKTQAAASKTVYNVNNRTFTIPVRWVEVFGDPTTMKTVIGSAFVLSFHSVKNDAWYERIVTINEKKKTIVFDPVDDTNPVPVNPTPAPDDDGGRGQDDRYPENTGGSTAAVDNSTSLADGVYQPDKFSFSGGSGRITIYCRKIEVINGKAFATIVFQNIRSGSTEMNYVKAAGGIYYCTQEGGASVVTIPVELNQNNTIIGLTTKMSAAHEITYTIFPYIAGASSGSAAGGSELTDNEKLDEKAPEIAGLEYEGEEEIEHAKFFKIFNYQDGIRLLEIDMRIDPKKEKTEDDAEDSEEADKKDADETDKKKDTDTKAIIDEETGEETTQSASKADAQAELYKGEVVKYLLVPEDVEIPAGLDKETIVIQLPIKSVYSGSDEISKIFEELEQKDLITSKPEKDKENKDIIKAGSYKKMKFKALVKTKCDLVLLNDECIKDKKEKKVFEQLAEDLANIDIPVILDRSVQEENDQAKAEWLLVYGILLGCEEEAQEAYQKALADADK